MILVETERQGLATRLTTAQGIGVYSLQSLLGLLLKEQRSGAILKQSPFRYRKSTIVWLRWCAEKGFVKRVEDYKRGTKKFRVYKRPFVSYHITEKGLQLLGLIS